MKFFRRFQQTKSQKPTAYSLIDVGRDSVKAAVVLMIPGNQEPQVVGYGRVETGEHDITGGRIEANAVIRPVNQALVQAEDSTERFIGQKIVPDDAVFALAGRAVIGRLFTVKQSRVKPKEPVTVKELNSLRVRAERLVRQGLSDPAFEGGQWQPLAVTDAGTHLDNRLVLGAEGLTGQEISFSVFGVAVQASVLRGLELLANRLDLAVANVVAAPQALASITPHANAILLDIGSSGTDVCLIKNHALVAADWMPLGGHFFTQSLARSMGIGPVRAKEVKHLFTTGRLPQSETEAVIEGLEAPLQRWYDALMDVLADLSLEAALPRRIYLTGGGSLLPGLDRLLKTNPMPFDAAPEVSRLTQPLPAIKDLTDELDYNLMALTISLTVGLPV
jgi:cell division ATPase FtsA